MGDTYDTLRYQPRLTTRDVASLLGVSAATVRQWVSRGHLAPVGKLGSSHVFDSKDVARAHDEITERRRGTAVRRPVEKYRVGLRPIDRMPAQDHEALVTARDAAQLVGVSPATIRSWIHRGHLEPTTAPNDGRRLLRVGDLMRVSRERTLPTRRRR